MRALLVIAVLTLSLSAMAQNIPCAPKVPGKPKICLSWTPSSTSGVTGSNIYRNTTGPADSNFDFTSPLNGSAVIPPGSSFWVDPNSNLTPNTTYWYTTVAVGTGGVLSPTEQPPVSAQTPVPPSGNTGLTLVVQ